MARIAGVNIPNDKKIAYSLTYIYGIGLTKSEKILKDAGIDPNIRTSALPETDLEKIRRLLSSGYKVEGDLRMEVSQNIKRLKEINTYRGTRHMKNLPARGQRTKTNARTKRGKKVTIGSGKKPAAQKT
jgi:small subunit ribosomal protein S13